MRGREGRRGLGGEGEGGRRGLGGEERWRSEWWWR